MTDTINQSINQFTTVAVARYRQDHVSLQLGQKKQAMPFSPLLLLYYDHSSILTLRTSLDFVIKYCLLFTGQQNENRSRAFGLTLREAK